jgi:hypothetical protein
VVNWDGVEGGSGTDSRGSIIEPGSGGDSLRFELRTSTLETEFSVTGCLAGRHESMLHMLGILRPSLAVRCKRNVFFFFFFDGQTERVC